LAKANLKRILGIDPGSVITGFGVIDSDGVRDFHVANGSIKVKGDDLGQKLGFILAAVGDVISEWQPAEVAIESVFISKNPMSALKLGQARGAAICAAVQTGLPIFEYAPKSVKQAAVGHGGAGKEQMQEMIKMLLSLSELPRQDAADGLAVALCHAHSNGVLGSSGSQASGRRRSKRWVSVP